MARKKPRPLTKGRKQTLDDRKTAQEIIEKIRQEGGLDETAAAKNDALILIENVTGYEIELISRLMNQMGVQYAVQVHAADSSSDEPTEQEETE